MKTTPIPTVRDKQKREPIEFIPATIFDGRREIKEYKYGYEYTLVEVDDRPANMNAPCFMSHSGFALHSFRKIKNPIK